MMFRKFPRHTLITLLTAAFILTACNVGTTSSPTPEVDVNALNTAIVGTTIAQYSESFTQTALAVTPTVAPSDTPIPLPTLEIPTADASALPTFSLASPTVAAGASPVPGFTQLPSPVPAATQSLGDECNNNVFEADVTIPDGSTVTGGDTLQKVWKIRNTGSCTWDEGYELIYIGGTLGNDGVQNFEFQSKDSVANGEAIDLGVWFNVPCAQGQQEGHWRMRNDQGYYFGSILSLYIVVDGKTGGCK